MDYAADFVGPADRCRSSRRERFRDGRRKSVAVSGVLPLATFAAGHAEALNPKHD
jgi:hypothetical protein